MSALYTDEDMVLVKNVHDTTGRVPPDGSDSWEHYWEKQTGKTMGPCSACMCKESVLDAFIDCVVGGHVIKSGQTSKEWYIVPLCKTCNHPSNTGDFNVLKDDLVLANTK